jgi:hypothetical protein
MPIGAVHDRCWETHPRGNCSLIPIASTLFLRFLAIIFPTTPHSNTSSPAIAFSSPLSSDVRPQIAQNHFSSPGFQRTS